MLNHWQDKNEWFNVDPNEDINLIELWHGSRFRELSYFWDSSKEILLPTHCTHCNSIVPTNFIASANKCNDFQLSVVCPRCGKGFVTCPQTFKGDPRNQAIIIHMDGWNPHVSSAKHSITAINITHATMCKSLRADAKNVRVYSFIPSYQLPRNCPHKYDAFLQPLLEEIEELYINGSEVVFAKSVDDYPSNDICTLRLIPLLFTADMIAHAEIGLVSCSGYKGCRRCDVTSEYINSHCRFCNFQKRYTYPCKRRTAIKNRLYGKQADLVKPAQRKALVKKTGVTGETSFYRLFDLCQFNPVYDHVIDAMHAVSINLIRTELTKILQPMGNNQAVLDIEQRDPKIGGVLNKNSLSKALANINWTSELKDGRVPHIYESASSLLGFWKAEECSKFALVAPFVLHGLVPQDVYDCFCLLTEIRNLLFSLKLRINGWKQKHIKLLRKCLWKHAIMYEHIYGKQACTDNLEYSLHMAEDIQKHSSLDNYWYFAYERTVHFHNMQSTNKKQICKTLADRVHQLRFVENYFDTKGITCTAANNSQYIHLLSQDSPILLNSSSVSEAFVLKQFLSEHVSSVVYKSYQNGICIGKGQPFMLNDIQKNECLSWICKFDTTVASQSFSFGTNHKKVLIPNEYDIGIVYRVGEHIVLQDSENSNVEWIMQIREFFSVGSFVFTNGLYYKAVSNRGQISIDDWTGQPKLVSHHYVKNCIQPTTLIKGKVMLYPVPIDNPQFYLAIFTEPIINEDKVVSVPYFPKKDDIIRVSDKGHSSIIKVLKVKSKCNTVVGNVLEQFKSCLWKVQSKTLSIPLISVICNVKYQSTKRENILKLDLKNIE